MDADKQTLMAEMYNDTFRDIKEGEIVKGTVVAINDKEVVIDIGFKSEGFVAVEEFRNVDVDLRKFILTYDLCGSKTLRVRIGRARLRPSSPGCPGWIRSVSGVAWARHAAHR